MPDEHSVDIRGLLRSLPVFDTQLPVFDPTRVPDEPVALFVRWLLEAVDAGVPDPHAMSLATADERGRPSSRVLICKDVEATGRWLFASSAGSRKGRELAANAYAALNFYWPLQGRQIRITGAVTPAGAERSAADFLARSPGARAEALLGRQSQILEDPAEAEAALRASEERLARQPGLIAADWTLYAVVAEDVEFWQADEQRRHIRLRYRRDAAGRDAAGWSRHRLWA